MLQNLTGWHALIILAIVVLIFGAAKLPALARSMGQSMRILREEAAERADAPPAAAIAEKETDAPASVTVSAVAGSPVTVSAVAEPAVRTAE